MWFEATLVNFLIHCVLKVTGFVNLAHSNEQNLQGNATWNVAPHGTSTWTADKAVDGNTNQTYLPTCAIAEYANGYTSVWWKVWLQRKFNIAYLEIYLRSGTTSRATGFSIYIYDDISYVPPSGNTGRLVYQHDPMSGCPGSLQNITVNKVAQGVAFFNERPDGFSTTCSDTETRTSVEICEVRVMECADGYYNVNCSTQCGNCLQGFCDKKNGFCLSGCKLNWKDPLCQECVEGYFGQNCSIRCGNCLFGFCEKENGSCLSGCKLNWKEPLCQECVDGFYDQNCSTQCGNCLHGFCDKNNGSCQTGCKFNWKEPLCQECADGYYGQKCSIRCAYCQEGHCDKKNGNCFSGCKFNWKEPFCKECVDGYYDRNCGTQCGNCQEGHCDKETGSCSSGCKLNWKEPLCQVFRNTCVDGYYDEDCSRLCGHCLTGVCDKTNGTCMSGCSLYWQEPLCQVLTARESQTVDEEFSKTSLVVISTLLGVLLLSALIIVIYIKRTRCLSQNNREQSHTEQMSHKDTEQKYAGLTGGKEDHQYTTIDSVSKESEYQGIYTYRNTEFDEVI